MSTTARAAASADGVRTRPVTRDDGRRRPGLTPAAIATAGRRLIERDGLDALTMRAVAAELDTAATSLYRHVADREALLLAILDQFAEGLPLAVPGRTPEARLQRRWVAAHAYMAEHVWVLHILIRGEMISEGALRFVDETLADFMAAGLPPTRAMRAYRACWHLTIGELLDSHPLTPPREPSQRQQAMARMRADELPALARVVATLAPAADRPDEFPAVLRTLLRGLLPDAPAPRRPDRG